MTERIVMPRLSLISLKRLNAFDAYWMVSLLKLSRIGKAPAGRVGIEAHLQRVRISMDDIKERRTEILVVRRQGSAMSCVMLTITSRQMCCGNLRKTIWQQSTSLPRGTGRG